MTSCPWLQQPQVQVHLINNLLGGTPLEIDDCLNVTQSMLNIKMMTIV